MLGLFRFVFLIWAIFGTSVYDTQLGLNQNDLDLQNFVDENNIQLPAAEKPQSLHVIAAAVVVHHHHVTTTGECCKDASPQCMACKAGMTVEVFCTDNKIVGCPGVKEPERQPEENKDEPQSLPDFVASVIAPPEGPPKITASETCTIERAENNQACPTAKCASPEAVKKKCQGKGWEAVKEISDPANCCLKPCNFRCKPITEPSHGTQIIINTNAIPVAPKDMPKEKDMESMDYIKESKVVLTPKKKTEKEEPKEVKKESKTVYVKDKADDNAEKKDDEKKQKKDPSVKLELFDSTITDDSFTFSYEIFNSNDKAGFYWTVQRKEMGSFLASTVEKDGESAPCSGYGMQGKDTQSVNVDVDCQFVPGKTYLLWFALDSDAQGSGVFLSPSEPLSLTIPEGTQQAADRGPSTTMSAYSYSLKLNNGKVEKNSLDRLAKAMDENQEDAQNSAEADSEDSAEVHHIFHVVNVQNTEQTDQQPEEKEPEQEEKEEEKDDEKPEKTDSETEEEDKQTFKDAVKEAKKKMNKQATAVLKHQVKKAKESAKDVKEVLKEATKSKETLKEKADNVETEGDENKEDLKDALQEGAEKAEKIEEKAEEAHEKAKKAVKTAKEKIEKIKKLETDDLGANKVTEALKESKEKLEEENKKTDEKSSDSEGKYAIGKLTSKGITVTCKNCPKQKNGKLYYLMLHHQQEHPDGKISAMHVFHAFVGEDEKADDDDKEKAVSGAMDLSDAHEFNIGYDLKGKTYKLYLASDADGKGKDLRLVDALDVKAPENELSSELTNTLNKWRQIFFGFFLMLIIGALLLSYRRLFPSKHAKYQQLLLDFEVYEDEF